MSSAMSIDTLVKQWLDLDTNPVTREQITKLYQEHNTAKLNELLGSRIAFGTAGLRSKMEAGFARLNNVTVLQTSQGLAKYIIEQSYATTANKQPTVVVGHDHRHNSLEFARITTVAFLLAGFKVYYLESRDVENDTTFVPTPFVPFAVDYYHADAGIMITASHNPAADNGYKVYWNNGCQIIPPNDSGIASSILENLQPWDKAWDLFGAFQDTLVKAKDDNNTSTKKYQDNIQFVKETVTEKYYLTLLDKVIFDQGFKDCDYNKVKFIYTPIHGVGYEFATPIFEQIFKIQPGNYHVVETQQLPDPDFSTVSFPNPEEKGALDMSIEKANELNLDLIVANDPDADRFSAAVRDSLGKFRQLTGNEIGFLFANFVIDKKIQQGVDLSKVYLLNSTVSSQVIKSMAEVLGFNYTDTLTGFKWIGNKAIELSKEGYDVPFGYEEAIGFMFPNVHDKDGIAATTVFLQLYYEYSIRQGISLIDKLEKGFQKFGYFKEFNGYYKFTDLSITGKIFKDIRGSYKSQGQDQPVSIGDFQVTYWRDLTLGYESSTDDKKPVLPIDSSSHMVTAVLKSSSANGQDDEFVRFTARGSGTEPKLKVYIEGKASTEEKAASLARYAWFSLREHWFKPESNNLEEVHP